MKQSCRALFLSLLFFPLFPVFGGISFGNSDLNANSKLLFTVQHTVPGALSYRSLFVADLEKGIVDTFPTILTCFPEKMELLSGDTVLQVRNRYGTALYSFASANLVWIKKAGCIPVYSSRQLPVSVSPDGKWMCFIQKTGNAIGSLMLENTETRKQILLNDNCGISYRDVPVRWSPDSQTVLYEKNGIVYFCSPSALFNKIQIDENFRKIGPGTINSVRFARGRQLVYIDNDIVYRLDVSELYTFGLYSVFVGGGTASAQLPLPFDPETDRFWVNGDASELVVIKSGHIVSWYKIRTDTFTYVQTMYIEPFTVSDASVCDLSVIWPKNGTPVLRDDQLSLAGTKRSIQLFRLENVLHPIISVGSPSCSAVSADETKVAFGSGSTVYVYDMLTGKQFAALSDETPVSLIWKGSGTLYVGGDRTVREWNVVQGTSRILFLSSADRGMWDQHSENILAGISSSVFVYDKKTNVWKSDPSRILPESGIVQNGYYRVYTGSTQNALYDNALYVRTLSGKAVTRPLLAESVAPVPPLKKTALIFDAVDNTDGLSHILSILLEYHLKCTFFINGAFIRRYPLRTNQIALSGQECASMFFTATDLTAKGFVVDEDFIRRGLARNEDEFYACTGQELALLWHVPYYHCSDSIKLAGNAAGYRYVDASVRNRDTVTLEDGICSPSAYHTAGELIDEYVNRLTSSGGTEGVVIPVTVGISHGVRSDYLYDKLELLVNALLDSGYDIVPSSRLR